MKKRIARKILKRWFTDQQKAVAIYGMKIKTALIKRGLIRC